MKELLKRERTHPSRVDATAVLVSLLAGATLLFPQEASAQLYTHVGSFAGATGGGPSTQTVSWTSGPDFTPRAVIFFWTRQDATGFADHASIGYGFATAPGSERAVVYVSDHNVGPPSNAKRWQSNAATPRCIVILTSAAAGTTDAEARLEAPMGPRSFTIRWVKKGPSNWIIHYLAIGGPDVTSATVGSFTPTASTLLPEDEQVTGVGFSPSFLMFLSIDSNTANSIVSPHGKLSLGFAGRVGNVITQAAITAAARTTGGQVNTSVWQQAGKAILEKNARLVEATLEANVKSFDADGFTITKTIDTCPIPLDPSNYGCGDSNDGGPSRQETVVHYLALGGGAYKVGSVTKPPTTGADNQAQYRVGFQPSGLAFFSSNLSTAAGVDPHAKISFSAVDAESTPNQRATFFEDHLDEPTSSDRSWVRQGSSGGFVTNGKVAFLAQVGDCPPGWPEGAGTDICVSGSTAKVVAEADVAGYGPSGFTLNWTTNVTGYAPPTGPLNLSTQNNAEIIFVALGAEPLSTADLEVTKSDGQASAIPGTPIAYTITVRNIGPDTVSSLTVDDPVPTAILGSSFGTTNGTYDSGTRVWTLASPLLAGQQAELTLSGTIDPAATGSLVNTASVAPPAGFADPDTSNNSASDMDTLKSADLRLAKDDTGYDPAEVGGLLIYTLTVTNDGPSDATDVTLTDPLAPEMDFDSATSSQGSCSYSDSTRVLTCTLGGLAASASATVTLTVRPMAIGTVTNSASVADNEDPDPTDNSASQSTAVTEPSDGVRFLTVTSTSQTNVLEWVNPSSADFASTEIWYRTDRFPKSAGEPGSTWLHTSGVAEAGAKVRLPHDTGLGSNGHTYYYGAFVNHVVAPPSRGRFCSGRPFDTSGSVKWAFNTGVFSITPPTVGAAAVIAPSNDHALYAMKRGLLGGEWPANWRPPLFGGPVQSRSPIVPITVSTKNPVAFVGAQDGSVYAVDGTVGGPGFLWGPSPIASITVQAAPAGIFTAFGGAYSYLLVGTRDDPSLADNALVAIDPLSGSELERFTNGGGTSGIGIINGTAAVDYATSRVYFTSHAKPGGSSSTLWCLQLASSSPGPILNLVWERALGDIDSSPVLRNGRVYLGSVNSPLHEGTVYSIDAATGNPALDRTFVHNNGQVKGFIFPDRSSNDIYFATDDFVWGVRDDPGGMVNKFASGISLGVGVNPSAVLFVPGSHYLYVGGSSGFLYELDLLASPPTVTPALLGDGLATVGAPSLDWPNSLLHVGTEAGIFYAVESPLQSGGAAECVNNCAGKPAGWPCSSFWASPCTESCMCAGICSTGDCSDGGGG